MRICCRTQSDSELSKVESEIFADLGSVFTTIRRRERYSEVIYPLEFKNWAVIALGGLSNKAKVGDMGIDGRIYPISAISKASGEAARELVVLWFESKTANLSQGASSLGFIRRNDTTTGESDFASIWYPIQVKWKDMAVLVQFGARRLTDESVGFIGGVEFANGTGRPNVFRRP